MKCHLFVSLILVSSVLGGKITRQIANDNTQIAQNYEQFPNNGIPSENNARIFSQEDLTFPARYFYPTYPEYSEYRYAPSGYNGAVIKLPIPTEQPISSWTTALAKLIPISSFALLYSAKAGILLSSVLLILILGLVFTTTICTFTPLCTISFPALALTRNQIKEQVAELAKNYITPESLNAATILVQEAVEKYTRIQSEEDKKETSTFETLSTVESTASSIQIQSSTNETTSTTESTVLV
ncbi:uncharacterized protein LOC122502837 [Leptopilina heterotoma]|uniref:uncharacterized protein LOC122502837 n=1 Tax=Leptopilina heterotoma TaxID=63436 RepID=UPI001CA97E82|nr:uncharacterized protein LOC122502837 [Leptopilina heterotoma]